MRVRVHPLSTVVLRPMRGSFNFMSTQRSPYYMTTSSTEKASPQSRSTTSV